MILHTVNKSSSHKDVLSSCLQAISSGDTLLLIENGVYAAIAGTESSAALQEANQHCTIAVLEADVLARGLTGFLAPSILTINDNDFVELTAQSKLVQSWY